MKILFIHQFRWSYVEKDLDILRSNHLVSEIQFPSKGKWDISIFNDLKDLWINILWCDLVFCWFGKLHAFFAIILSRIFHKPMIVVAGDDDVCRFRFGGKKYGMHSFIWKRPFANYVFRHADIVLPVSKSAMMETQINTRVKSDRLQLVYHGFDAEHFKQKRNVNKLPLVLTISRIEPDALSKGLELFIRTAEKIPKVQFMLVGPFLDQNTTKWLTDLAPSNVTLTGWLEEKEFMDILQKAKVYVQVSFHEGFGCSVAEAMLCECVPVVSRRTSLPEVVGDCGFYVDKFETEVVADKIREALETPPEHGMRARQRIIECFPLEKRKKKLLEIVSLLGRN